MSDIVLVAIIGGVVSLLLGGLQTLNLLWTKQLEQKVNGRMDELLSLTRTASHAAGVLQEKDDATRNARLQDPKQ